MAFLNTTTEQEVSVETGREGPAKLTLIQAYRTMVAFLDLHVEETHSEAVDAEMWEFRLGPHDEPGDPGTWGAWIEAVRYVTGGEPAAVSLQDAFAIARQFLAVFAAEISSAEFRDLAEAFGDPQKGSRYQRLAPLAGRVCPHQCVRGLTKFVGAGAVAYAGEQGGHASRERVYPCSGSALVLRGVCHRPRAYDGVSLCQLCLVLRSAGGHCSAVDERHDPEE